MVSCSRCVAQHLGTSAELPLGRYIQDHHRRAGDLTPEVACNRNGRFLGN
jgi:hypothetical protein